MIRLECVSRAHRGWVPKSTPTARCAASIADPVSLLLFVGNETGGRPGEPVSACHASSAGCVDAAARAPQPDAPGCDWRGACLDRRGQSGAEIEYSIALVLAADAPAWFWHVRLTNTIGTDAGSRPDLCAGSGAGAVWRRAHERVLRQSIPRSHAAAPRAARRADRLAPESGGRWTPSLVPDRLAANGDFLCHRRAAVSWTRQPRGEIAGRH